MDFSRDVRRHFLLFFVIFTTKKSNIWGHGFREMGNFEKLSQRYLSYHLGPIHSAKPHQNSLTQSFSQGTLINFFSNSHNSETAGPVFLILKKSLFSFGLRI